MSRFVSPMRRKVDGRLSVVRIELERGAQRPERLLLVFATLFPKLSVFPQNGDLLASPVGELEPLLVQSDEVPPIVGLLVERAQDLHDAGLVLVDLAQGL